MAKGIRVNQLAKELGVESKAILTKMREEGVPNVPSNHQGTISLGLAESVREWFSNGSGGTAVETAAPPEVAVKPRTVRSVPKKKPMGPSTPEPTGEMDSDSSDESQDMAASAPQVDSPVESPAPVMEAPVAPMVDDTPEAPSTPAPVAEPATAVEEAPEAPIAPVAPAPVTAPAPIAPQPVAPPPVAPPPAPVTPVSPAPVAPVQPAPIPPSPALRPAASAAPSEVAARPLRPTVTLDSGRGRGQSSGQAPQSPVVRKPVVVAPQAVPRKAVIQGPKIVREEAPEHVPAPRARRPLGQSTEGPGYTTARPTTGRGVRVDDEEERKKAGNKPLSTRRRGPDGRRGEAMEKLKEYTEADLIERRDRLNAATATRASVDRHLKQTESRGTHVQAKTAVQRGGQVEVEEPITVKSLSSALGVKANDIISRLMRQGVFASINQGLDRDTAETIALDYGLELVIAQDRTLEEELIAEFEARETPEEVLVARPPVVTILGHVDHGKTSLLDKIRNANVAAGEAGGITQHTAAWQVEITGNDGTAKRVTFIDTPGHQAFTAMRARGANMTDVVVLVVSAAEGVQPQTIESINHARAAGVPIVVALNKIDRPDANPDMVLGQLAGQELNPVEWGGQTEVIRTSAVTGQGIKELIEILDYQAELLELKADPTSPARGVVIESRVDPGLGAVATVLVQDGTLKVGDVILSGSGYGRIRSLLDDRGQSIPQALPATPVIVSGLSELPSAGEKFYVTDDVDRAREIAEQREDIRRQQALSGRNQVSLDSIMASMKAADTSTINLIIKADVQGSLETLVSSVTGQNTEEVKVRVIHSGVGGITESDVELAMATKAKPSDNRVAIIGFHVVPDDSARALAEQNHVDVKTYRVIYEIFDDLKKALSGMLAPEEREKLHGHAEIRQVYKFSKVGNIAGCMVTDGHISRGSKLRLIRDGRVITEDLTIETLKRVKDDVKEVKSGFECGIKIAGYDDIKQGDRLEAYVKETFQRTL